ncbi:DoxX family membrane protein [Actinomadura sp. 6K520]|uniref:DoxX family protein n=1 Tax=Actinomadura sp. 6K520 TaxID=2530364 RepID=UPI00104AFADF|nr:DoxX family membrane protein [Actinomadura sp. 6K520]TDE27406.1 DoxX family membrane protein [Actinomadura sp. 6K520]
MAPLMFLIGGTLAALLAGRVGVRWLRPWPVPLRVGLALMFTVTGIAHFVGMREALIDMVPPALPAPGLLVTVTGVLELAGAAALLWERTAPWAAGGLSLMLIGMFPANVHLALNGTDIPWDDRLLPRTVMQVVFLAATLAVVAHHVRRTEETTRREPAKSLSGEGF